MYMISNRYIVKWLSSGIIKVKVVTFDAISRDFCILPTIRFCLFGTIQKVFHGHFKHP